MKLKGMKSLVFGANGYIGSHLTHKLISSGSSVAAFDLQEISSVVPDNYQQVDITDKVATEKIDWNADLVFIFSGITGTYNGFEEYEKFIILNELGLLNILNGIRKSGRHPRVIFPSSRLVYKGSEDPLTEDAPKEAKTIYALNKLSCEKILDIYHNTFGIDYTVYRICVPYGNILGSDYSFGTIGSFLTQIRNNGKITLFGDGSLRRTLTHIEDVCDQMLTSCTSSASADQVYNIAGEEYSLNEIAQLIAEKYNGSVSFSPWPDKDLKIESGHTVFDGNKLLGQFQIGLKHHFKEWLHQVD